MTIVMIVITVTIIKIKSSRTKGCNLKKQVGIIWLKKRSLALANRAITNH